MSGFPLNSVRDAQRFRNAYLGTLSLQQEINSKNFNANALYKRTGVVPTEISDYRSTSEKLADIARLRIAVRGQLREIADSSNAEDIAQEMTSDQVQFVAQNIDALIKELKPKYKLGIVKDIFIPYLVRYMNGEMENRIAKAGLSTKTSTPTEVKQDDTDLQNELANLMASIQNYEVGIPRPDALSQELAKKVGIAMRIFEMRSDDADKIDEIPESEQQTFKQRAEDITDNMPSKELIQKYLIQLSDKEGKTAETAIVLEEVLSDFAFVDEGLLARSAQLDNDITAIASSVPVTYSASNITIGEVLAMSGNELSAWLRGQDLASNKNLKYPSRPNGKSNYGAKGIPNATLPIKREFVKYNEDELFQAQAPRTPRVAESKAVSSPLGAEAKTGSGMRGRGVGQQEQYAKLGRYHIVLPKLRDDIVAIHNTQYKALPQYKTQRVSVDVGNVLRKIVGGGSPSFDDLSKLSENDKSVLDHIARVTKMAVELPTPSNDKEDANQFEIMKGEIMAGNDSKEMIKKFKVLILKMSHNGRLPKSQCKDLLIELAELGY